jgi:hypothetical protein
MVRDELMKAHLVGHYAAPAPSRDGTGCASSTEALVESLVSRRWRSPNRPTGGSKTEGRGAVDIVFNSVRRDEECDRRVEQALNAQGARRMPTGAPAINGAVGGQPA